MSVSIGDLKCSFGISGLVGGFGLDDTVSDSVGDRRARMMSSFGISDAVGKIGIGDSIGDRRATKVKKALAALVLVIR